ETRTGLGLMWVVVFTLLTGIELLLRFGLGWGQTYTEANGTAFYVPLRHTTRREPMWVHRPDTEVYDRRREFEHRRRANSLGLSEVEIPVRRESGEYRIVALGDSYTEGVGAPYESTWVRVMERTLRTRLPGRRVTAVNAGVAGSDPCLEYV